MVYSERSFTKVDLENINIVPGLRLLSKRTLSMLYMLRVCLHLATCCLHLEEKTYLIDQLFRTIASQTRSNHSHEDLVVLGFPSWLARGLDVEMDATFRK